MKTVAVIDYGMGNLHSVSKALERVSGGTQVIVTYEPERILRADRVVLPGVGAIRDCMAELQRLELDEVILEVAKNKPLLGVCVGMQALLQHSAENDGVDCLGVLPGQVEFFMDHFVGREECAHLKVPHMGWNQVRQQQPDHPLWRGIEQDSRFYFVHSYFAPATTTEVCVATADYGVQIAAAVLQENVFATQFHPEKSADDGLRLYANFLAWDGQS